MIIATVERRRGDISKDKAPNRKRSLVWRFGAFFLARLNTMSCCLSKRFSAIVALVPPDLSDFANSTKRCMKRKATDFMSGMLSRHPATTRLHIDLLFCGDYQFAMHRSISSLSGIDGDATYFQMSAPIQPGNSGGPVLNSRGEVVGVVAATAAIEAFYTRSGALPQNINWAVKSELVGLQLEQKVPTQNVNSRKEAIALARNAICKVGARSQAKPQISYDQYQLGSCWMQGPVYKGCTVKSFSAHKAILDCSTYETVLSPKEHPNLWKSIEATVENCTK